MSYRSFQMKELHDTVDAVAPTELVETATGGIVFTEYGARLLGLFPDKNLSNVLWVHKQVESLIGNASWLVGGERLWIAPERHFFYENPRDFEGFHVPAGMDPGNYADSGDTTYVNTFTLIDLNSNELAEKTTMKRVFTPCEDPYGTGLAFAGARIHDSVTAPGADFEFSAWSLAQVYTCGAASPGTALFPISKQGGLLNYFDPIPDTRGQVRDGYARFRIDAAEIYKLGIAPEDMLFDNECKAVYVSPYPAANKWFCVVKRSNDMPRSQQECVDYPKSTPEGTKGAIQAYNNGPDFPLGPDLAFGEIELQLVKGSRDGENTVSSAEHELLAYAGTKDEILELAATALGIEGRPEVY